MGRIKVGNSLILYKNGKIVYREIILSKKDMLPNYIEDKMEEYNADSYSYKPFCQVFAY